jgi:hypothetical protein
MILAARIRRRILVALWALAATGLWLQCGILGPPSPLSALQAGPQPPITALPLKPNSVRFAIIGDSGTGDSFQNEVAQQMVSARTRFPFEFVVMLGDNIYGGHTPRDFSTRFELPYKPLLDAGLKFYAALGNHDDPMECLYKPFNMDGKHYYAYSKGNVRFIVLDSNYMDAAQLTWVEKEVRDATSPWKIVYFHHPLYSDGKFHGPNLDLRSRLEPLFEQHGVNVVLSGHEHVYERIEPQHGIYYFILGNAGELRIHNLKMGAPSMAAGFDEDRCFMLMEVAEDELYFQTITRTGGIIDSGVLRRQQKPVQASTQIESRMASFISVRPVAAP